VLEVSHLVVGAKDFPVSLAVTKLIEIPC
jgi:hypothetical protein